MKVRFQRDCCGFTMIELLGVIVLFLVILVYMLPSHRIGGRAHRVMCLNNLKQIGVAAYSWASDHDGQFPMLLSTNNGGTMEYANGAHAYRHFEIMSNELAAPKILHCPADKERDPAKVFNSAPDNQDGVRLTNNATISYFISLDASTNYMNALLAGDRNITTNTVLGPNSSGIRFVNTPSVQSGILIVSTNQDIGWTDEIHHRSGNAVLPDASAQTYSRQQLEHALQNTGFETNRLLMP